MMKYRKINEQIEDFRDEEARIKWESKLSRAPVTVDSSAPDDYKARYEDAMELMGALLNVTREIVDRSTMERFDNLRLRYHELRDSE